MVSDTCPPLLWAGGLLLASTIGYLWWGLHPEDGGAQLTLTSSWDWLRGIFYSFRVMTLLKPDDLVQLGGKEWPFSHRAKEAVGWQRILRT